jgi:putative phosphoribosyl transferase
MPTMLHNSKRNKLKKMMYKSRLDAAIKLIGELKEYKNAKNCVVCALPRGGVEVGALVAKALNLPMELICAKKIGAPGAEEFAIGAVTNFGHPIWQSQASAFSDEEKQIALEKAKQEATDRFILYYHERTWPEFKGKTVILIDDGIATGATMEAAIHYLRTQATLKLVLAVPVSPIDTKERLAPIVDAMVIPLTPTEFFAVGQFYEEFPQLSDQQVLGWIRELIIN